MTKKPTPTGLTVLRGSNQPVPDIAPLASWIATTDWLAHLSHAELATLLAEHWLVPLQPATDTATIDLLTEAIDWLEQPSPSVNTDLATRLTIQLLLYTQIGTFYSDLLSEILDRAEGRYPHDPQA